MFFGKLEESTPPEFYFSKKYTMATLLKGASKLEFNKHHPRFFVSRWIIPFLGLEQMSLFQG